MEEEEEVSLTRLVVVVQGGVGEGQQVQLAEGSRLSGEYPTLKGKAAEMPLSLHTEQNAKPSFSIISPLSLPFQLNLSPRSQKKR